VARYFIKLCYRGTNYCGWQKQKNDITVQQVLEQSLSIVLRKTINIIGCGRTDTGVHAREFYAHFDVDKDLPKNFVYSLNSILPTDISILSAIPVIDTAHARYDVIERTYKYYIINYKNPFYGDYVWYINRDIDVEKMNNAASRILNYNDFKCFCKKGSNNKTTICNIKEAVCYKENEYIIFSITADRFLRNMVRAIVGTIAEVGLGKITIDEFENIIKYGDRSDAKTSAPASGLFLEKVIYPNNIFL